MKKNLKALFSSLLAAALVLTGMTVAPAVDVKAEGETTAYLSFADGGWTVQYWNDGNDWSPVVATTAEVTGNGQYTVGLDFTGVEGGVAPDIAFFDVEISNGETAFPNSYMTIDSVKINGEEVALSGKTYTSSDDGVATRTNLYNTWVEDATTVTNARTADGDATDIVAAPVDGASYTDIATLEVTFTLGDGVLCNAAAEETTDAAATVEAKELPAEGTTAYVSIADANWTVQYWFDGNDYSPVVANNATVTGYGQYTVGVDFTGVDGGVCPDLAFMDVEVAGGEEYFPNSYMTIDSVKINGEEVALSGKTYTSSDDGVATRTNLYNTWVEDATTVTNARTADGDATDIVAAPVDGASITDIATVEVTFTLGDGVLCNAVAEETTNAAAVDLDGTYNAYLGFQTPVYSFRNAFDDATYGRDSDVFNQVTGWDADNNAVKKDGTFTDAVIAGNGTYTVSVDGLDLAGEFDSQEYMNLIFLSTDIPNSGEITISDIQLKVDGKSVDLAAAGAIVSPDSPDYLQMLLQNTWNADVATLGYYSTPMTSMSITFTVSGFNYDAAVTEEEAAPEAAEEAPAAEETVADSTEEASSSNTGLIVGIIIAVVVVAGVVVGVVVAKKKKAK